MHGDQSKIIVALHVQWLVLVLELCVSILLREAEEGVVIDHGLELVLSHLAGNQAAATL